MKVSRLSHAGFSRRPIALALGAVIAVAALPAASAQAVVTQPPVTAGASRSALPTVVASDAEVQLYIESVYQDLFGRQPDAEGLATWTAALQSGTPRVAVANAITSSPEFRSELIDFSYRWYLDRLPDADGLNFWLGKMASGYTISQMEAGFIGSPEFYAMAGSTDIGWVAGLYGAVLQRTPSVSEVDGWTKALHNGASRQTVSMGFLLSTEHLSTVVDGYYQSLLRRHLDPAGQVTWVHILQAGGRDEAIIGGIIASDEYWVGATTR
jgi:hypothetical protein